jgi:hypothetical protein
VLFAAEKAAGSFKRFASREIDSAMRAGNHRFLRSLHRALSALAGKPGQEEVGDYYRDDEKEELTHWNGVSALQPRPKLLYRRKAGNRSLKAGRGDWIRTSDTCVPNAVLYQAELHPESDRNNRGGKSASGILVIALDREGGQF